MKTQQDQSPFTHLQKSWPPEADKDQGIQSSSSQSDPRLREDITSTNRSTLTVIHSFLSPSYLSYQHCTCFPQLPSNPAFFYTDFHCISITTPQLLLPNQGLISLQVKKRADPEPFQLLLWSFDKTFRRVALHSLER